MLRQLTLQPCPSRSMDVAGPPQTPTASTPLLQQACVLSTAAQQVPLCDSSYRQQLPLLSTAPAQLVGMLQKVPCRQQ